MLHRYPTQYRQVSTHWHHLVPARATPADLRHSPPRRVGTTTARQAPPLSSPTLRLAMNVASQPTLPSARLRPSTYATHAHLHQDLGPAPHLCTPGEGCSAEAALEPEEC
eukprot:5521590-Alexandrium_andersonii.AAC.1